MVCNEGPMIAKEVEEKPGAQILRKAAERPGDPEGDRTSGATMLAHAMSVAGVRDVVVGHVPSI